MALANRRQNKQFAEQRKAMNEASDALVKLLPDFVTRIKEEFGQAGQLQEPLKVVFQGVAAALGTKPVSDLVMYLDSESETLRFCFRAGTELSTIKFLPSGTGFEMKKSKKVSYDLARAVFRNMNSQIERGAYQVTAEGVVPALTRIKKAEKAIAKRLEVKEEERHVSQAAEAKVAKTLHDILLEVKKHRGALTQPLVARWVSEPPARKGALPGEPEAYFEFFCLPGNTVRVHCTMDGFERVLSTQYDPKQPDQANLEQLNMGSTTLETFKKINALLQERLKTVDNLRFIVPSSYTLAAAKITQQPMADTPEEEQGDDKEIIILPRGADEEYGILSESDDESLPDQIRGTPLADVCLKRQPAFEM